MSQSPKSVDSSKIPASSLEQVSNLLIIGFVIFCGVAFFFWRQSEKEAEEVASRAAAQIDTDWELSEEGKAEVKASVEAYAAKIKSDNEARDEAMRKINAEIDLKQRLRAADLRRAAKKDAADIAEIEAGLSE